MKNSKFFSIVCCFAMLFCMLGCENTTTNASGEYTFVANPNVPGAPIRNPANAAADDEVQVNIPSGGGSSGGGSGDTIGDTWGATFVNKQHSPIDMQIWDNTVTVDDDKSDGLKLNIRSGWGAMLIVQKGAAAGGTPDCVYYDMSNVAKVVFKAKASKAMHGHVSYSSASSAAFSDANDKPNNLNVTTEWQEYTFTRAGVDKAFHIFSIILENVTSGDIFYVKDIDWQDADGNSVALKYAQ